MFNSEARKITRKLGLLVAMLTFLAALSIGNFDSKAVANGEPLICCSACEGPNPPRPCLHGCSPSCRE